MITVALQKQYRDSGDNADWTAPRCDSHGGQLVTQLHCTVGYQGGHWKLTCLLKIMVSRF